MELKLQLHSLVKVMIPDSSVEIISGLLIHTTKSIFQNSYTSQSTDFLWSDIFFVVILIV